MHGTVQPPASLDVDDKVREAEREDVASAVASTAASISATPESTASFGIVTRRRELAPSTSEV